MWITLTLRKVNFQLKSTFLNGKFNLTYFR